jgi:histidine phosphotransferase ChpT
MNAPDLTGQVVARLCHDLLNPLGALGNGLELLDIAGSGKAPERELMSEALASATARLRFLRRAFGSAGAPVTRKEMAGLTEAYFAGSRIAADWSDCPPELSGETARLVALLILCLQSSLPQGGMIGIGAGEVSASGPKLAELPLLWGRLAGQPADLPPSRDIHFALAAAHLRPRGQRIVPQIEGARIRVQLPG